MHVRDYAWITVGSVRRQMVRSVLTIVALAISTVILITMIGLSIGGNQVIMSQYGNTKELLTITVTPSQAAGGLSVFGTVQHTTNAGDRALTDQTAADLAQIPHVTSSVPRTQLWELRDFTIEGFSQRFVAQTQGVPSDDHIPLSAGSYFTSNDETNAVIIGRGYAKDLGLGDTPGQLVGKKIIITTQPGYRGSGAAIPPMNASTEQIATFAKSSTTLTATIVGVTDTGPDQNNILVPLGWAHNIRTARSSDGTSTDQLAKDGYTSIKLTVDDSKNLEAVSRTITDRGFGQFSAKTQIEQIGRLTVILWLVLGTVAFIAALAAALGITNTMLMTITEQRTIIGIWRAVGATRAMIIRLFIAQAALLGLVGGIIGSGLSYGASFLINTYASSLLQSSGLSATNIAVLPLWLIAAAIIFTTAFAMLAGLYPAIKAARQDPSDALRGE